MTSIGYMHSVLTRVFRQAMAEGIIDRDPTLALSKPAAQKAHRRALTKAEADAALKVGNEHPEGLLLLLLYYTGMRLGEVLGLQWHDVDFNRRVINVRRDLDYKVYDVGPLKTPAAKRQIPMPDELCAALDVVRGVGHTFVLTSPESGSWLAQSTLKRRWERLMIAMYEADPQIERTVIRAHRGRVGKDGKRADDTLIYGSMLTAHYFRHNYASVLYNAGVDILSAQRFMGHADPSITMAVYSHLAKDKEDESADLVRDAISGKVARKLPETKTVNRNTKSKTPKR
jgi:integrase